MRASNSYLFDGKKAVNINDLPPEAWTPSSGGSSSDVEKYHRTVPWLYRGTDLRAKAVASLPFAIVTEDGKEVDTSDDYQNALEFLPNPKAIFELTEASLTLLGRSYLFRERNLLKTLALRYVLAQTVTPIIVDQPQVEGGPVGLIGFKRQLASRQLLWDVDDVVYFWGRDPFVELGPPKQDKCPGMAALQAAGVLHNLGTYASAYFERGAVRPMVMTLPGQKPPKVERDRIKAWLRRVFLGFDNAFTTQLFQEGTEFQTIGDGIGELSDSNLTTEQREDICVALGIPMTMLWSTEAGGLGGGGVVTSDERKFWEMIVQEAEFIASTLNEQLFSLTGHRLVFRPETLDVFQVDENQRSQSFERYVNTGIRLSVAAQMLGLELPEGVDYDDLDSMKEEDKEAAAERMPEIPQGNPQNPQSNAMRADLARWERKALNKGADCGFDSQHIPETVAERIRELLAVATTDEEVKAAFRGPFRESAWESYP